MAERLPVMLFALVMAAIPFIPGVPPFWIVLLDNIGLSALVAMGLVLLTGVGGLTSFGQAAFCGFGAYTTAVLTTAYGLSPWLTLPLSLIGRARPHHRATVRPLSSARHHRLGPGAVLPVQQA
jgi:ABC-type branched-subunit amino acid transport system permease subunit